MVGALQKFYELPTSHLLGEKKEQESGEAREEKRANYAKCVATLVQS